MVFVQVECAMTLIFDPLPIELAILVLVETLPAVLTKKGDHAPSCLSFG
jgi:hypothetical protein